MKAPVLFLIFNRPDTTQRVFSEIRKARPEKLFIAADGPRTDHLDDSQKCQGARSITQNIDWPCEVKTLFREQNLGCKAAVSSAIDWFFEQVEEGIILEDDCLPNQSFFSFCQELLERYRNDMRVMHISGNHFQQKNTKFVCSDSYYFSRIPHIWGWATWKRAWKKYDVDLCQWPNVKREGTIKKILGNTPIAERWEYMFQRYHNKEIDNWDNQWAFACMLNGLSINPTHNLVSNIGFRKDATHRTASERSNLPTIPLSLPLRNPLTISVHEIADAYTHWFVFGVNRSLFQRMRWFCKRRLPWIYTVMRKARSKHQSAE